MLTVNHIALIPRRLEALGEPRPAKSGGGLATAPFEANFSETFPCFPHSPFVRSFFDPLHFVSS